MSSVLAIGAVLTTASTKKASSSGNYLLILVVLGVGLLYFFVLRPRQQRQRQTQQQMKKAEIGDEVQTVGGLIGTIVAEDGDRITISTGPGHELTYLRQAIARKIPPPVPVEPDRDPEESSGAGPHAKSNGAQSNGAPPSLPAESTASDPETP